MNPLILFYAVSRLIQQPLLRVGTIFDQPPSFYWSLFLIVYMFLRVNIQIGGVVLQRV